MPKNNNSGPAGNRSRRTTTDPAAAPVDIAGVTGIEPLESADERSGNHEADPSYEDIA